jgi:hypothetical protein
MMISGYNKEALKQLLYIKRKKLGRAGRSKERKPQRWIYPWTVENRYAAAIRAWLRPMMEYVHTYLRNNEEAILRGDSAVLVSTGCSPRRKLQTDGPIAECWVTTYILTSKERAEHGMRRL